RIRCALSARVAVLLAGQQRLDADAAAPRVHQDRQRGRGQEGGGDREACSARAEARAEAASGSEAGAAEEGVRRSVVEREKLEGRLAASVRAAAGVRQEGTVRLAERWKEWSAPDS